VYDLNYHHLQYFWLVAKHGNLTAVARRLHVSQSVISTQIRQLEDKLGNDLFERRGRTLVLTETGRVVFAYAEEIFTRGNELIETLRQGRNQPKAILRIGAVATLSRNFQERFIDPLLCRDDVRFVLHSGSWNELLGQLTTHSLDFILANRCPQGDSGTKWLSHLLARQPLSLVGPPREAIAPFKFPDSLLELPMLLPGAESDIRVGFDLLCERYQLKVNILAEVDDMALLRVLARSTRAAAVVPAVVVRDELRSGVLEEYCVLPDLYETFYCITIKRSFQHPLLRFLIERNVEDIL